MLLQKNQIIGFVKMALVEHKLISGNKLFNPEINISKSEALIMFIKSI
jgi:hypothetical protein